MHSTPAYDPTPEPYLYLPKGWDAGWRSAKASAASTPFWLTCIGDSIAAGAKADGTIAYATGWLGQVVTSLQSKYGAYAEYFPSRYGPGATIFSDFTAPAGGSLTGHDDLGWNHCEVTTTAAQTGTLTTITLPYDCTEVEIIIIDGFAALSSHFTFTVSGSGSFAWNYFSGGATTPTAGAAGTRGTPMTYTLTDGSMILTKIQITTPLPSGTTIALGGESVPGACVPIGVNLYRGTTGFGAGRVCVSGVKLDDYRLGTNYQTYRPELFMGKNPQWDAQTAPGGYGFPTQPHLLIYALGINDGVTNSFTYSNVTRFINAVRRARSNASVLILNTLKSDGSGTDLTTTEAANSVADETWPQYLAMFQQLAQQYTCGWVNMLAKWGATPVGQGFMAANNVHPTLAGHTDIANILLSIL